MHKWRFVEAMIADAPDHKGVYILWNGALPLAVGHALGGADTIRSRLASHLSHECGSVTHYSWQLCVDPKKRAAELERQLLLVETKKSPRAIDEPRALRASKADTEPAQET